MFLHSLHYYQKLACTMGRNFFTTRMGSLIMAAPFTPKASGDTRHAMFGRGGLDLVVVDGLWKVSLIGSQDTSETGQRRNMPCRLANPPSKPEM